MNSVSPTKCRQRVVITATVALAFIGCTQTVPQSESVELTNKLDAGCQITSSANGGYWIGVNTCLSDYSFKSELQKRIKTAKVLRYTEGSAAFPSYFTKSFMTINNTMHEIPTRFDVWDAYVIFATKGANPYKSGANCSSGKLLDWYDYQCYDTPSEIMSVSSGGQQDAGGADTLAAAVPNFGTTGVYNREHSWVKSWFAAGATAVNNPTAGSYCYNGNSDSTWDNAANWDYRAYTDLHHVIPARAAVNNSRGACAYGIVLAPDANYPRTSGAKFGTPDTAQMPGYAWSAIGGCGSNRVFEPPAELKGDIARNYFYMSTRYYTEDTCWTTNSWVTRANMNTWLENLMRQWHNADPVSDEERARNDWIYRVQGNRNPFIDHPEWVSKISDF